MLNPNDRWVWDFWHTQNEDTHHLFYLQAPRSLGDPELRHRNATIGHATSTDLRTWTEHGTVLRPGRSGSPDATATWTGSVVRGDDNKWRMFYTGSTFLSPDTTANVEVITVAVSDDLYRWRKDDSFVLRADPRWYEILGDSSWPEEAWRDPWVYRDDAGMWHMLITARANTGGLLERGVIGHATSDDLTSWQVQPPLTTPGHGFAHLEVPQEVRIAGRRALVFAAHDAVISDSRKASGASTGTWIAPWDAQIDLDAAHTLTSPDLYSGRIIEHADGPVLLAFRIAEPDGTFAGGICDPIPLADLANQSTLSTRAH